MADGSAPLKLYSYNKDEEVLAYVRQCAYKLSNVGKYDVLLSAALDLLTASRFTNAGAAKTAAFRAIQKALDPRRVAKRLREMDKWEGVRDRVAEAAIWQDDHDQKYKDLGCGRCQAKRQPGSDDAFPDEEDS